ncbi:MAG TPA: hypothetical protein VMV73_03760 [Candidatus Dormibacteraeota bacterium]|nr:hypothetical protein [Candidatus Dormibacteraeota bacterium]
MTLRAIRGSLVLGLLAALVAHVALFGGQHAIGGAYHALLMQATSAVSLGFVVFVGALAWGLSGNAGSGRVLSTRLREELPGIGSVVASAAAWYAGIEAIEPHHLGAPVIALIVALTAASYLVFRLARAVVDGFALVAVALCHSPFSPRLPAWGRRPRWLLILAHSFLAGRRFARPPPIALGFSRA